MPERHSDISGTSTDDRPTYHPPQTVKRRFNFFRGMTVFGVPSLSAIKSREAAKQADMPSREKRHGQAEPSKQASKLHADAGLRRLSRPQRKRMLARLCAERGVKAAAGLASKR